MYPQDLLTNLQAVVWYVLTLRVDDSQGVTIEVYQKDNSAVKAAYGYAMPAGKSWRFHYRLHQGIAYLDEYKEFSTGARLEPGRAGRLQL